MSNESDETTREEELVITPAGPRPKDRVHAVGPGEAVSVDESGNARVMPRAQEGETVNRAQDMILTPGGLRHKSLVHLIEPGHVLDGSGGHHRKLDPSGRVVADFGLIAPRPGNTPLMPANVTVLPEIAPAFGSGWIAYADWSNTTGTSISSFSTTWTVPPAPATQSGQLLYLFNGIQNSTMIYQPVLQWGNNGAFGGNYWLVASWYADGQGGQAFYSQNTQVNPGDTLVGVMTLTAQSGGSFSYTCQFQGIATSGLPIQNVQQLTWCAETLEAYGITRCSDYPDADDTAFRGINIQTGSSTPTLNWSPVNAVTDCGQHVVVVSNSNPGSEVDIYYTRFPTNQFTPVYAQGDPGNGIGGYDLKSPADRVFAFDYDGSGKLDHLALYRPGTGTIWILQNSGGQFTPVYAQGDPGNGIGGYDLKSSADRVFAFDYDSSSKLDHLTLYRPGTGTIWILKKR